MSFALPISISPGASNAGLRLRADLIAQPLDGVEGGHWVVKDPISNEFHFFSDMEMKIMRSLDGQPHSVLKRVCSEIPRNEYLSTEGLVAFLADLQQRGLLRSAVKQKNPGRYEELISPLAIRLPGFNPEALLNRLYHVLSWIYHPVSLLVAGCIMVLALAQTMFHAERFVSELTQTTSWLTADNAWTLVAVIAVTKIFHELTHGLTCRHFGGRCSEMGVMLLVFIPCLYCDVSDTWLQPNRWARVAVSAAGICAELFLASCAALIWSTTGDGVVHATCFAIMLVGSIKTLVFNGNPLMRNDGYFILSDLWRVPNLAIEARHFLAKVLKSALLGTPPGPAQPLVAAGWLLLTFAVASIVYQFVILVAILYGMHRAFQQAQLAPIGGALVSGVLCLLLIRWWRSLRQLRLSRIEMRYVDPGRLIARTAWLLGGLLLILFFPLPRSISVPYTAEACDMRDVHTVIAGQLVSAIAEATPVHQGDWLATLFNPDLEREINVLRAEEATLLSRLDQALHRKGASVDAGNQIPEIRSAIDSARRRRELREAEHSRLTLTSPIDGVVFGPRIVNPSRAALVDDAAGWRGSPLDPKNRGCYILPGTEICSIGSAFQRRIAVMVSQGEIELIRPGQLVRAFSGGLHRTFVQGVIESIETSPVDELSIELIASGKLPIDSRNPQSSKTLEPVYRVIAKLDDDRLECLPVRTVGTARIYLKNCSLVERIYRFISSVFLK